MTVPRIEPRSGPRVTYVHAPAWFGLDGLIGADILWPRALGRSVESPTDALDLLAGTESVDDEQVAVIDLRGDDVAGVDLARHARSRSGRRVVLIADRPPPQDFPVFGTRVVGPGELVLSANEVREMLADAGYDSTPEVAGALRQESAGWPSLVEACAAGMRRGEVCDDAASAITMMRVAARCLVVAKMPDAWVAAAREVAVRIEIAPEEFEALDRQSSSVIREMLVAHLLVPGAAESAGCLQLVPAVQMAVMADLEADHAELLRLRREVAQQRSRLGTFDAGLAAAFAAGDHELCAEILDNWTMKFAFTEHRAVAQRVTLALPNRYLARRPSAALRAEYLGTAPVGSTPIRVPTTAQDRRDACRTDAARKIVERTFLAMVGRRTHGRFAEACNIASATTPLVELGIRAVHSSVSGIAPLWYLHAGLSNLLGGNLVSARHHWQKGWQARRYDELGFVARDLASKFALLDAIEGASAASRRWLRTADSHGEVSSVTHWIDYTSGLSRLLSAVDGLDQDSVEDWLDRYGDGTERDEFWIFGLRAKVDWELSRSQPAAARRAIEHSSRMPMIAGSDGIHFPLLHALGVETWLADGQAHPASRLLAKIPETSPVRRVPAVRLLVMTGRHEEALAHVTKYVGLPDTPARDRVDLLLSRAVSADALSDRDTAVTALTAAVRSSPGFSVLRGFTTVQRDLLGRYAEQLPDMRGILHVLDSRGWGPIFPAGAALVTLSTRETAVLEQLAAGGSNQEIAAALQVSTNTVKTQLRGLYTKLGANTRDQAIAQARALGLLG